MIRPKTILLAAFVLVLILTTLIAHGTLALTSDDVQGRLPTPTAVPLPSLLADVAHSGLAATVTVEAEQSDHEELGTAWLFDSSGDFVTNAHVIAGARQLRIRDRNNQGYGVAIVGEDDAADIAMLRVPGFKGTPLQLNLNRTVSAGEKVVVLSSHVASGHGDISFETITDLHASATTTSPSTTKGVYQEMLRMTGDHIYKGNSGGPILNERGLVVGIATLSDAKVQTTSYAIPLSRVLAELNGYASG